MEDFMSGEGLRLSPDLSDLSMATRALRDFIGIL